MSFFMVISMFLTGVVAGGSGLGFLDPLRRWFSTNTRTLDFPPTKSETTAGMSYRGPKSTTFNGIECLPWGDVFSRCTQGFEEQNWNYLQKKESGLFGFDQLQLSGYLSHMSPDRLGLGSRMNPPGLFDSETYGARGHNECRVSSHHRRCSRATLTKELQPLPTSGPFCFVNTSDPRAVNFTKMDFTSANG